MLHFISIDIMPVLCWWYACADNTNLAENCDISHKLQFFCAFAFLKNKKSQSSTRVKPFICTMPMRLDEGWNQIQFNLSDFTRRAYGTNYVETMRLQVHANCRIRRIYFSDRLYSEEELPPEFKLFLPIQVWVLIQDKRWSMYSLELGFYMLHVILYVHTICNPRSNNKSQQQFFL
jgi:hypothetical protein